MIDYRCITADDEETKEMAIDCARGEGGTGSEYGRYNRSTVAEESIEVLLEFLQDESSDIREKVEIN